MVQTEVVDPEFGNLRYEPRHTRSKSKMSCIGSMLYTIGLIFCKICVVLAILAAIPTVFVILCIVSVIMSVVLIPLLLLTILAARLVQSMSSGGEKENLTKIKVWSRTLIGVPLLIILFVSGVFYVIARKVPSLNHGMIVGVPVFSWVIIMCMICGLTLVSNIIHVGAYATRQWMGHHYVFMVAATEIVDCLLFWWVEHEVMQRMPAIKHHELLGLRAQKWIECALFMLIGFNVIRLFTQFIVWLMQGWFHRKRGDHPPGIIDFSSLGKALPVKYMMFYANGIRSNVNFLLTSLLLLLTWVLYFGSRLSETSQAQRTVRFGTWTFSSLLIFSFMCLLKAVVLLSWESSAIYIRLSSRILQAGKQLYFFGIISRRDFDVFGLLYVPTEDNEIDYDKSTKDRFDDWGTDGTTGVNPGSRRKLAAKKRHIYRDNLLLPEECLVTIYDIQQIAQTFLATIDALSKDVHIPLILEKLNPDVNDGNFEDNLRRLIDGENYSEVEKAQQDSDVIAQDSLPDNNSNEETQDVKNRFNDFEELLKHAPFSQELSYQRLQSWMERSHINCILTGNIISNAKEAVTCLDNIISWTLIGVTFLLWLILTGLASTQVLVLIASPLLAATFIFGDTCKSFFQGIMFIYVVHPFDVGDLCAIEGKLMEVKSIGVWKTIFTNVDKVGGQESVIFPNSELSNKVVINHRSEFDCNDYVQFSLRFDHHDEKIRTLISEIKEYLNCEKEMFTAASHSVGVQTTEDSMKILVRFRHNIKLTDATYFECLRTKDEQRTTFILFVQNLVNKLTKASSEQAREETMDSGDTLTNISAIVPYQNSEPE